MAGRLGFFPIESAIMEIRPLHSALKKAEIRQFIREMHQLQRQHAVLWFHTGKVLPCFDHYLGDADLIRVFERVAGCLEALIEQALVHGVCPRQQR